MRTQGRIPNCRLLGLRAVSGAVAGRRSSKDKAITTFSEQWMLGLMLEPQILGNKSYTQFLQPKNENVNSI